jgi:hypothetical protein
MRSEAFSAIITTGACVLPDTSVGMIEQSTALSFQTTHFQMRIDDRHAAGVYRHK